MRKKAKDGSAGSSGKSGTVPVAKYRRSMSKATPTKSSSDDMVADDLLPKYNHTAVDSKYSWFVVFCSFFCNLIVDGMQYTFSNFLIPIILTFGSTTTAVSLIGSLLSGFYNFSGPLAGALANKFGFRMVTITGSLISCFGLSVSYFATDIRILYFTYGILGGLGFGMIYMASVITTSLHFDKYRALATSISVCGTGIGTFIFSPFGNFLVNSLGWRLALVVEAAIVLLCSLFGLSFKPVEVLKFGSSSEIDDIRPITGSMTTIRTVRTLRESVLLPPDQQRPLPNQAYPTLKEALLMQDDDGKRSISKSARASTIFSLGPRSMGTMGDLDDDEERFIGLTGYDRRNCVYKFRNFCFNFWHCRCHEKRELTVGNRPMYRDDVFYEGSLSYLRHYSKSNRVGYHLSVIRMPHERDAVEQRRQKLCGCHEAMLRACVTMLGLDLLKDTTFVLLCISSFMFTMGVFIPYMFLRSLAEAENMAQEKSIWLVSSIGIANTLGRIICGIIMSCWHMNAACLVVGCTAISSIISFIVLLPVGVETVFLYATVFGFFTAPFVSLRPVVIVQFLGLDKLTNAFGLVLLSQGIASILGPPLAGAINEATGHVSYTIVFAGTLLFASTVFILGSTLLARRKLAKGVSNQRDVGVEGGKKRAVDIDDEPEEIVEEEDYAIVPPNGGWGWVVVLSAFYCNVVADGIQLTFGVFLQKIGDYFDVEKSKISLVGSLMFGTHLLIGPVCSGLSNVYGIRPVTAVGTIITATGLSLCYVAPRYEYLYFFYGVLGGVGLGLVYMNTIVITSLYFTSLRVLAVAIVVCGTGCGTVAFAFLGNELLKVTDWQTSFLIEAAFAGSLFPAALTFRPLKAKRIIFTTDKALLSTKPSLVSRVSRFSRASRYTLRASKLDAAASWTSRRPTVYIRQGSHRSISTGHSIVLEKLAREAIVHEVTAQACMCRCCRRLCCRRESVVFMYPNDETLEEYMIAGQSLNASKGSLPEMESQYSKHVGPERKKACCDWSTMARTIREMLDFKLLRSYAFLMFCFSGSFAMASLLVVLMYEKDRSIVVHGYSEDTATMLIVTLGAANMFWRLFLGLLSIKVKVHVGVVSIVLALIGASAVVVSNLWDNLYFNCVACIIYALGMASFAVYRPVLLFDLVGADFVLNATGISLLFMGVACIIAPPLCGVLMEAVDDYSAIFYAAGALLAVSALLLVKIDVVRKKDLIRLGNFR